MADLLKRSEHITWSPTLHVELDFDKALGWLQRRFTYRYAGVSSRGRSSLKHLLEGVKKGAFDEAEGKTFQRVESEEPS